MQPPTEGQRPLLTASEADLVERGDLSGPATLHNAELRGGGRLPADRAGSVHQSPVRVRRPVRRTLEDDLILLALFIIGASLVLWLVLSLVWTLIEGRV